MTHETCEGVLGFVIIFSLFLNKNVFILDMLLAAIYGVKFYSLSYVLLLQILKNNEIDFQSIFCFLVVHFQRASHKKKIKKKKAKESRIWQQIEM